MHLKIFYTATSVAFFLNSLFIFSYLSVLFPLEEIITTETRIPESCLSSANLRRWPPSTKVLSSPLLRYIRLPFSRNVESLQFALISRIGTDAIQSLATFKGDLASLTAPPFLLSPQSIVEYSAFWAEHPSLFVAPGSEPDPEKRALLVLKWFLSTLKQQHSNKDENGKKKRMKPLNPFLGELFIGKWEDDVGTTNLVAEQVSHHPPITACNIWNDEHGVRVCGFLLL